MPPLLSFPTHRFQLGSWQFTIIQDGQSDFTAADFFPQADGEELSAILADFDLKEEFPVSINILLAQGPQQTILVDTGIGRDAGGHEGQLVTNLEKIGVEPAAIDVVLFTHGHWDHIGGAVSDDGERVFTNARHLLPEAEWDYWSAADIVTREPGPSGEFAVEKLPRLADVMETFTPGPDLLPGVRSIAAPGHTVGHVALQFDTGAGRLLHFADAVHHPLQIAHPYLKAAYDHDGAQAVSSRRQLIENTRPDDMMLAYHFPFPGLGRIVNEDGPVWRPA